MTAPIPPRLRSEPDGQHLDTAIVDELTTFLNRNQEPAGADAISLLCDLVARSGRPLLTDTWPIDTDVDENRYGIATATVTAGTYTIRVCQAGHCDADLRVEITTEDGDDYGLAIRVDGRPVLDPMPCSWRGSSTVPSDLQLTPPADHRRAGRQHVERR